MKLIVLVLAIVVLEQVSCNSIDSVGKERTKLEDQVGTETSLDEHSEIMNSFERLVAKYKPINRVDQVRLLSKKLDKNQRARCFMLVTLAIDDDKRTVSDILTLAKLNLTHLSGWTVKKTSLPAVDNFITEIMNEKNEMIQNIGKEIRKCITYHSNENGFGELIE